MKYDFIIIGSGLGGLCTGIILAKEGKKVLILEQHTKPGGYLHSFYRKGHRFETGFHFAPELDKDQILYMYWNYLGILDKIDLIKYNKDHFHSLIFPDFKIDLPSGLNNLQDKLSDYFPDEKNKIINFINKIKEIKRSFIYFNKDHIGNLDKEHESFKISLIDYLDSLGISKKLKAVLTAHSFLYGVPPNDTPLGTHSIFFNALYSSAYDLKGGGDALSNALIESFLENGGEILYKKKAVKIKTENKIIKGIETEDENYYEADNIIADINPKNVFLMFEENVFRDIYKNRITDMKNTISHYALYFTTDYNLDRYNYDILYFPDYEINNIYNNCVSDLPDDFFIYLTIPTARIGRSKGKHIIETLSIDKWENYVKWANTKFGKRPSDYIDYKNCIKNHIINKIDKKIIPIKDSIDFCESSTPLSNYHFTLSPNGSIYGIEHNMEQMRAPIRARTKLKGFYFTGQSLIFPGIVGVTITSFVTCADIIGQKYLFDKIDAVN